MASVRGNNAQESSLGAVLQILRDGRPRTKAELTELTELARSTVSARVDTLLSAHLLAPAGEAPSTGGRPPKRLAFHPRGHVVIAADLGATKAMVALCDLAGTVLASVGAEMPIAEGPERVLDWVVDAARTCLRDAGRDMPEVVGVGVGVPGPVEHATGRPNRPQIMPGWDGFDVPDYLGRHLPGRILVDNDVNVAALGERATIGPGLDDLLFVKVSTGIGAGIIAGGQLQRGAQGTAGDIGHVQVPRAADSTRPPNDQRDLEAIAAGPVLAAAVQDGDSNGPAMTAAQVVAALRRGDGRVFDAVRQAGRDVGEVVALMVNVLNPSVIVVGGSIGNAGEALIAGIREVVYRRSTPLATKDLLISQSRAGDFGGAIGAAHMVIDDLLGPDQIEHFVNTLAAAPHREAPRPSRSAPRSPATPAA